MGRILVRGEPGHDIIDVLHRLGGEPVIEKPRNGAAFMINKGFLAGAHATVGALLTFFGFMHEEAVGIAITPSDALAYATAALFF